MRRNKAKVVRLLVCMTGVIIIILTGFYRNRNHLLKHFADKHIQKIEQDYGLHINYETLHLKGLEKVCLSNITVIPENRDTLLKLRSAEITLRLGAILNKQTDVQDIHMNELDMHFI